MANRNSVIGWLNAKHQPKPTPPNRRSPRGRFTLRQFISRLPHQWRTGFSFSPSDEVTKETFIPSATSKASDTDGSPSRPFPCHPGFLPSRDPTELSSRNESRYCQDGKP